MCRFKNETFFSTGKEVKGVANCPVKVTSNDMPAKEGAACYGRSQIGVKDME